MYTNETDHYSFKIAFFVVCKQNRLFIKNRIFFCLQTKPVITRKKSHFFVVYKRNRLLIKNRIFLLYANKTDYFSLNISFFLLYANKTDYKLIKNRIFLLFYTNETCVLRDLYAGGEATLPLGKRSPHRDRPHRDHLQQPQPQVRHHRSRGKTERAKKNGGRGRGVGEGRGWGAVVEVFA